MKELLTKLKQNKLLFTLTIIMTISTILGILFPAIISKDNKLLITTSIKKFMTAIDNNNIDYLTAFLSSITNNSLITIILWILGLSLIGVPIILLILFFKGFITGFSLSSILITYGIKGLMKAFIYTLPNIINLLGTFLLSYYAISFSTLIYKSIFKKENRSWHPFIKRYTKIGIFFLGFAVFISIIESYLIPKILIFL